MHWYWQKLWTRSYEDEFQWISCLPHLSWPVSDEPHFATGAKHIKSVVSEDFPLALWSSPTWHCPSPLHSVSLLPLATPSWRAFLSAPSTRKILQVHSRWGETPAPSHRKADTLLPPYVLLLSCRSPCSQSYSRAWKWQGEAFPPAVFQDLTKQRKQLCPGSCKGSGARTLSELGDAAFLNT